MFNKWGGDSEFDRIQKIKNVISKYGIENFYISFSGGKDSVVLSNLVDLALPNNEIPRVYADTGIELNIVRDFVFDMAKRDDRVVILKPNVTIKQMLEKDGYPFKSKFHSEMVAVYQNNHNSKSAIKYRDGLYINSCPKCLRYQFSDDFKLKISDKCCYRLKEELLFKWQKENNKPYVILGLRREEGGRRGKSKCLAFKSRGRFNFQPLVVVTKSWEEWFIEAYGVEICDIYNPPYNFDRTGCKGCPYNINLQKELDVLEKYFPAEKKTM